MSEYRECDRCGFRCDAALDDPIRTCRFSQDGESAEELGGDLWSADLCKDCRKVVAKALREAARPTGVRP